MSVSAFRACSSSLWRFVVGVLASVVAIGIGLNLLVMGVHNGSMPVRADILLRTFGVVAAPGTILVGSKDVVIDTSPLWLLSDWIILSLGATKVIVSPGDLIIVAGVAWWLLFSQKPEKDQAHADIIDQTGVARTAGRVAGRR